MSMRNSMSERSEKIVIIYENHGLIFRGEALFSKSSGINCQISMKGPEGEILKRSTFFSDESIGRIIEDLRQTLETWCQDTLPLLIGVTAESRFQDKSEKTKRQGRPMDEETKRKISVALKGRPRGPMAEETRRKISESMKERKAS